MKIKVESVKISNVIAQKEKINLTPLYQRGSVWSAKKRKLLIDSILTGIDIPKIYFHKVDNLLFTYEVSDGQQRLRAILDFIKGDYKLDKCVIDSIEYTGLKYADLNKIIKDQFDNYELTISYINEASAAEVRTLFARLQMGEQLIPSELRNAIPSNVSYAINLLATSSKFFLHSKIPSSRFKHQDYIAHAIALVHFDNKYDLKAALLLRLYQELAESYPQSYFKDYNKVLEKMYDINKDAKNKITTKWAFVDIFYFLYRNRANLDKLDHKKFAKTFLRFEDLRLKGGKAPEKLIEGESTSEENKNLYFYIQAFKTSGGNPKNIQTRQNVFDFFFSSSIGLPNV